jgi:hypothetical protein
MSNAWKDSKSKHHNPQPGTFSINCVRAMVLLTNRTPMGGRMQSYTKDGSR